MLNRELSKMKDQLMVREDEISELKSERNNTRVSYLTDSDLGFQTHFIVNAYVLKLWCQSVLLHSILFCYFHFLSSILWIPICWCWMWGERWWSDSTNDHKAQTLPLSLCCIVVDQLSCDLLWQHFYNWEICWTYEYSVIQLWYFICFGNGPKLNHN